MYVSLFSFFVIASTLCPSRVRLVPFRDFWWKVVAGGGFCLAPTTSRMEDPDLIAPSSQVLLLPFSVFVNAAYFLKLLLASETSHFFPPLFLYLSLSLYSYNSFLFPYFYTVFSDSLFSTSFTFLTVGQNVNEMLTTVFSIN